MGKVAWRKVVEENDDLGGYYTEDDDYLGEKGYKYYEKKKAEQLRRQQKRAKGEEMETESDSEDDGSKGEPGAVFTIDQNWRADLTRSCCRLLGWCLWLDCTGRPAHSPIQEAEIRVNGNPCGRVAQLGGRRNNRADWSL